MVGGGEYVRAYHLSRPPLAIEVALEAITRACTIARKAKPEQATREFDVVIGGLLPTAARDKREHWRPDREASVDDWIRLAVYLGATDGFRQQTRAHLEPPTREAKLAYLSAYSMAYAAAGIESTQQTAKKAVRHG